MSPLITQITEVLLTQVKLIDWSSGSYIMPVLTLVQTLSSVSSLIIVIILIVTLCLCPLLS